MVRETFLPDFFVFAKPLPEGMRISAPDELNGSLQGHISGRRKQQMDVLGHQDKGMELEPARPPVAVDGPQEQPGVRLDDEEPCSLPSYKRHERSARRGDQASGLHEQTSAAGSRHSV